MIRHNVWGCAAAVRGLLQSAESETFLLISMRYHTRLCCGGIVIFRFALVKWFIACDMGMDDWASVVLRLRYSSSAPSLSAFYYNVNFFHTLTQHTITHLRYNRIVGTILHFVSSITDHELHSINSVDFIVTPTPGERGSPWERTLWILFFDMSTSFAHDWMRIIIRTKSSTPLDLPCISKQGNANCTCSPWNNKKVIARIFAGFARYSLANHKTRCYPFRASIKSG